MTGDDGEVQVVKKGKRSGQKIRVLALSVQVSLSYSFSGLERLPPLVGHGPVSLVSFQTNYSCDDWLLAVRDGSILPMI